MIEEYSRVYRSDVRELLNQLQLYVESIDKEGYNIFTEEFGENYLESIFNKVNDNNGKIYLYKDGDKAVGIIIGVVNNEEDASYGYKLPKRGKITDLIVLDSYRHMGIGTSLIKEMEKYFDSINCKNIIISTLAYGSAINFYDKLGYHMRMVDMVKDIKD